MWRNMLGILLRICHWWASDSITYTWKVATSRISIRCLIRTGTFILLWRRWKITVRAGLSASLISFCGNKSKLTGCLSLKCRPHSRHSTEPHPKNSPTSATKKTHCPAKSRTMCLPSGISWETNQSSTSRNPWGRSESSWRRRGQWVGRICWGGWRLRAWSRMRWCLSAKVRRKGAGYCKRLSLIVIFRGSKKSHCLMNSFWRNCCRRSFQTNWISWPWKPQRDQKPTSSIKTPRSIFNSYKKSALPLSN